MEAQSLNSIRRHAGTLGAIESTNRNSEIASIQSSQARRGLGPRRTEIRTLEPNVVRLNADR